jgi:hypothetical protein
VRRTPAALLLVLALAAASCRRDPVARLERDPEALAVVGRFAVTKVDLGRALACNQAESSEDPWVKSRVWDDLLDQVLVLNDLASAAGPAAPEPLGALSDPKAREAAVETALQDRVYAKVEVGPELVAAYYRDHADEFARGSGVLVREMLLPGPTQAGDAEKLLKRGHSFADVARLYSLSPRRGAPQYFLYEELPDYLRPVLERAVPGTATPPIRVTDSAYQILLLEGRFKSYAEPLEDAAPEIRLRLFDETGQKLKAEYLEKLRSRFRTVVFSSKLPFDYQKESP